MHNCFWKEEFYSWQKMIDISALKNENIHCEHIWYNPHIRIDSNSAFLKSYFNAGFIIIIDLFDSEGNFISLKSLNNLHVKTNFLEYTGLKKAVIDRIGITILKRQELKYKHIYQIQLQFSRKQTKVVKICIICNK